MSQKSASSRLVRPAGLLFLLIGWVLASPALAQEPMAGYAASLRSAVLYPLTGTEADAAALGELWAAGITRSAPGINQPVPGAHREASSPSNWLSYDKLQHVTFSFLFTLSAQYVLVDKLDVNRDPATPIAAGTGLSIGVAKEMYDRHLSPSRRFDLRDLAADTLGVLLATGLIVL